MELTLTCGQCNRTWSFEGSHGGTRAAFREHRAEYHADEGPPSGEHTEREPGEEG